jgi:hypothetical protein
VMLLSLLSPASCGTCSSRPRSLTLPVLLTAKAYDTEVPASEEYHIKRLVVSCR